MDRFEKRRHPRLKKSVPLKISGGDFDIVTETENVSLSGAYCKIDRYIEPMTKLKILMLLPLPYKKKIVSKKIECEGVVVRTKNPAPGSNQYNIAIFFSDLTNKDKKVLSECVEHHIKHIENK